MTNAKTVSKNTQKPESKIKEVSKTEADKKPVQLPQFLSLESTLGAASLLAMKSQSHKFLFASDLEWLILPPIAHKQFALFRSKKNEPVAFVSWAKVNEEVEKRLLSGSLKLQAKDWNSGDKTYIVDIISPFAPAKEILKQLQEQQFKNVEVKTIKAKKDGKGFEAVLLSKEIAETKAN